MHPQDELSRIKMRNRRYMNACAQENSLMNVPMFGGGGPFMRGMPMNAPMGPSSTIDYEMAQDELNVSFVPSTFLLFTFVFHSLQNFI